MRLNPVTEADAAVASLSESNLEPTRKMRPRTRIARMSGKSRRGLVTYVCLTALAAVGAYVIAYLVTRALL